MTIALPASSDSRSKADGFRGITPFAARALLILAIGAAAVMGFVATGSQAPAQAVAKSDAELTTLLHAMTVIKGGMALIAAMAIYWRLRSPVSLAWLGAYVAACVSMAAGIGLIWNMEHLLAGALLLHAGLFAAIVLVWRDPEVGARIAALVASRRAALLKSRAQ